MDLRIGQIQIPRRLAVERHLLHVADDADDLDRPRRAVVVVDEEARADRLESAEPPAAPAPRSPPPPRACCRCRARRTRARASAGCAPLRNSPARPCGTAPPARARVRSVRPSTVNGTRDNSPLNGKSEIAPVFVTAGSDDSRAASARWNVTIASRLLKRFAGSVRRADSTRVESNPGATACTFAKLFASIVTTMSSTTASATSALTSSPTNPLTAARRPAAAALQRVAHVDARRRERGDDAEEHAGERRHGQRERQHGDIDADLAGRAAMRPAPARRAPQRPNCATSTPSNPPGRRRAGLRPAPGRTTFTRDDPSASCTARSLRRPVARVSIRFARFAQAISSTAPTAANSVSSARAKRTDDAVDHGEPCGRRACLRSRPETAPAAVSRSRSVRLPPAPARSAPASSGRRRDEVHRIAGAAPRIPIGGERQHELDVANRCRKPGRRDADDRVILAIEPDRAADDARSAAESPDPEGFGENDDVIDARLLVGWLQQAADPRLRAEDVEEIPGGADALDALGRGPRRSGSH
mgnify:CR=1 FL=1